MRPRSGTWEISQPLWRPRKRDFYGCLPGHVIKIADGEKAYVQSEVKKHANLDTPATGSEANVVGEDVPQHEEARTPAAMRYTGTPMLVHIGNNTVMSTHYRSDYGPKQMAGYLGAPAEHRQQLAVVVLVTIPQCTVAALDEQSRYKVNYCTASATHLVMISSSLRVGYRLLVASETGSEHQQLNVLEGFIVQRPRAARPYFVRSADGPELAVCVLLDRPPTHFPRKVLLARQFIAGYSHHGPVDKPPGFQQQYVLPEKSTSSCTRKTPRSEVISEHSGRVDSSASLNLEAIYTGSLYQF